MRKKFFILSLFLTSLFLIGTGCSKQANVSKAEVQGPVLFVGYNCPHCAKVEEFAVANKVQEKFSFTTLEVYKNKDNAALMTEKAKFCGLSVASLGVPFLWDGSKCLVGDIDIIQLFQDKIK